MIYFAQRAPTIYNQQLSDLCRLAQPLNICSVIGGLSFLHALNARTLSLTLVDPDPDTHLYCRMILELIRKSISAQEFLEILTNHKVSSMWWKPGGFSEPQDMRGKARQYLADSDLVALYDATYGAMRFDPEKATGRIGESIIKFYGDDLTPMTFCWKIGAAAFSNVSSFSELKTCLEKLKPTYIQGRFEELDLESIMLNLEGETALLVSNTESPLFSRVDSIFREIENKIIKPIRYISWQRNIQVLPRVQISRQGLQDLQKALSAQHVFSIAGLSDVDGICALPEGGTVYKNLNELRESIHYGWGTFFVNCSNAEEADFDKNLTDVLREIIPCVTHILFWGKGSLATIIQAVEKVNMERSYELFQLKFYAQNHLMYWRIKGCIEALKL